MATGGSVFRTGASVFLNLIPRSRITNHFKCRMHAWLYIFQPYELQSPVDPQDKEAIR